MSLNDTLSQMAGLDQQAVEHIQDVLLDEIEIPEGMEVYEEDVEIAVDGTGDWQAISFSDEEGNVYSVWVLSGSHRLQISMEDDGFTSPVSTAQELQAQLEHLA